MKNSHGVFVSTEKWMDPVHWEELTEVPGPYEFIAIGRRYIPEFSDDAQVLALHIRWKDGFAERVNTAEINEQAWIAATRTWKLIALK